MEDIKYIQATSEHVNILVDLRIIFSNEMSGKQDKEAEANLRENLTNYFTNEINKSYLCWFATVNGEVSSIAGLGIRVQPGNYRNPSGIWGYIMSVYTLPQHRKKGLSTNILNRLVNSANEKGITSFELHSTKDGEPIYIKSGFVIHNEPTYRKFV